MTLATEERGTADGSTTEADEVAVAALAPEPEVVADLISMAADVGSVVADDGS